LDKPLLHSLFKVADTFGPDSTSDVLKGRILATFFYEESTRTRNCFESAAMRLGAGVLSTPNAKFSSVAKGESLEHTIRVMAGYSHGIVLRHSEEGAAKRAALVSRVPIINAGDGRGQHPTQALLDVYTIQKELGRLDNFGITFVGDLAYGRTVRSLCYLLGKLSNGIDMTFVSPENLRVGEDIKGYLKAKKVRFKESGDLEKALPKADIIYVTRIQKERMSAEDYGKARGLYVINTKNLDLVRPDARIMHPLPIDGEVRLPKRVEGKDPRVAYFRQAEYGMYIRMALLVHMLRKREGPTVSVL
jgi:aspartate carbamoyltransferase catalytic subunit